MPNGGQPLCFPVARRRAELAARERHAWRQKSYHLGVRDQLLARAQPGTPEFLPEACPKVERFPSTQNAPCSVGQFDEPSLYQFEAVSPSSAHQPIIRPPSQPLTPHRRGMRLSQLLHSLSNHLAILPLQAAIRPGDPAADRIIGFHFFQNNKHRYDHLRSLIGGIFVDLE